MPLNVTSNLNIDTLKTLDANKLYYLSKGGQVKEASAWMRFKCFLGIPSALQKAANLVDSVRESLLEAAGDKNIKTDYICINRDELVSGNMIAEIAKHFCEANQNKIDVHKEAKAAARDFLLHHPYCGDNGGISILDSEKAVVRIFDHALKQVKGDSAQKARCGEVKALLEKVIAQHAKKLPDGVMSERYAQHIINTCFNADGTLNAAGVSNPPPPPPPIFNGKMAEEIAERSVSESGIVGSDDVDTEIKLESRMIKNVNTFIQQCAMETACPVEKGKNGTLSVDRERDFKSDFLKDFRRGFFVKIGGVEYKCPLSAPENVQDEAAGRAIQAFVRFVTDDENATFDTASDAVKLKVKFMAMCVTQKLDGALNSGIGHAFDNENMKSKFSVHDHPDLYGGNHPQRTTTNEFSKDKDGNITFSHTMDRSNGIGLGLRGEVEPKRVPNGSSSISMTMKLPKDAFDKYANAKWEKFPADTAVNCKKMSLAANEPNWPEKIVQQIPEEYRLEIENLDVSISVTADELKEFV